MGVPVLYFGADDYRTSVLSDIGITMHPPFAKKQGGIVRRFLEARRFRNFQWRGETPNIAAEKEKLISAFREKIAPFV